MSKQTITMPDIRADLSGLDVHLSFDNDCWSLSAESELLGCLGGFPCETRHEAFVDFDYSIDCEIGRVMISQLTAYQIAVMASGFHRTNIDTIDLDRPQGFPAAAHVSALDRLYELGLADVSGRPQPWSWYGAGVMRKVPSSGWVLTEDGVSVFKWWLSGSDSRKVLGGIKVKAALVRLGVLDDDR